MKKLSTIFLLLVLIFTFISCSDAGAGGETELDGNVVYRDHLAGTSWTDNVIDVGATLVFNADGFTLTAADATEGTGTVDTDLLSYDDLTGLSGSVVLNFSSSFNGADSSEPCIVSDEDISVTVNAYNSALDMVIPVYSGSFTRDQD